MEQQKNQFKNEIQKLLKMEKIIKSIQETVLMYMSHDDMSLVTTTNDSTMTTTTTTNEMTTTTSNNEMSLTTSNNNSLLDTMNISFLNYLKKIIFLILLKINGYNSTHDSTNTSSSSGTSSGTNTHDSTTINTGDTTHDSTTIASTTLASDTNLFNQLIFMLIKDRFIIEKSNQLKAKLKYQFDKIIKSSFNNNNSGTTLNNTGDDSNSNTMNTSTSIGGTTHDSNTMNTSTGGVINLSIDDIDPLAFKPNINALNHLHDTNNNSNSNDNDNENNENNNGIYKPPKLAPVHFDEDRASTKSTKLSEKIKEKAKKSRLLRDLQQQYDDAPEDMDAMGLGYSAKETLSKLDKELDDREEFEEANFIRLTTSKKLKKQIKNQMSNRFRDEFDDLKRDFRDLRGVHSAVQEDISTTQKVGSRKDALIQKRNQVGDGVNGMGDKKRSFKDVDELISGMAKSKGTKDQFKAARRITKRLKSTK